MTMLAVPSSHRVVTIAKQSFTASIFVFVDTEDKTKRRVLMVSTATNSLVKPDGMQGN